MNLSNDDLGLEILSKNMGGANKFISLVAHQLNVKNESAGSALNMLCQISGANDNKYLSILVNLKCAEGLCSLIENKSEFLAMVKILFVLSNLAIYKIDEFFVNNMKILKCILKLL